MPQGQTVVSPAYHQVFATPRELVRFVASHARAVRRQADRLQAAASARAVDFLAICKAMLEEGITPDFVTVDGAEGGTGAAPRGVLRPRRHAADRGPDHRPQRAGRRRSARRRCRVGASGKVSTGVDIVKRIIQGADYTNAARAMMMAVGCIQAQTCHTNTCPVGVATQDPRRMRALAVGDKSQRVDRLPAGHRGAGDADRRLDGPAVLRGPATAHAAAPDRPRPGRVVRRDRRACSSPASCSTSRRSPGAPTGSAPTRTASPRAVRDRPSRPGGRGRCPPSPST